MESISVSFQRVSFGWEDHLIFDDVSLDLPMGRISLLGPNGAGKSTFLYLATARVLPLSGKILLWDQDTAGMNESQRDPLASILYQNMEFEHDEPLGDLLERVEAAGRFAGRGLRSIIIRAMMLDHLLGRPASRLSKGEMQRAVLAFCLLYGSRLMALDEPVFAMEQKHKESCLGFVKEFSQTHGLAILASLHELELSRKFFDYLLLISPTAPPRLGTTEELYRPQIMEELFQAPWNLLKKREDLYRDGLLSIEKKVHTSDS